jgi:hypothetical protein
MPPELAKPLDLEALIDEFTRLHGLGRGRLAASYVLTS